MKKWIYLSCFLLGTYLILWQTSVGHRFLSLTPRVMGTGARAQWIMQADEWGQSLPLTGFGLDSLIGKLKRPVGPTAEDRNMEDSTFQADRTHNILYDILLQTGWIGLTLTLLCFGSALAVVKDNLTTHNIACMGGLVAYVVFSCMNPPGILAHVIAVTCLFGIRK